MAVNKACIFLSHGKQKVGEGVARSGMGMQGKGGV
jgi:hypothetical protein